MGGSMEWLASECSLTTRAEQVATKGADKTAHDANQTVRHTSQSNRLLQYEDDLAKGTCHV